MASPGAGKTSLIVRTIRSLAEELPVGVIEGDLASTVDAEIVAAEGAPVIQINTGGSCHLDARMIAGALPDLPLEKLRILIIENVGNLICTAGYDLGEHARMLIASVPEGDDKPFKYPSMFHKVELVVLNKTDLKPYVKFDLERFRNAVKAINEQVRIIEVSCQTGEGIPLWLQWLRERAQRDG